MHPALSILLFTTLAGAGQGLIACTALLTVLAVPMPDSFVSCTLAVGLSLLVGGLVASFFHLGHKTRAWRAVLMWRTSWMSREVIVMPAVIAVVGAWLLVSLLQPGPHIGLALAALAGCMLLWICTAMIYACLPFIQEWAHPLTLVNFTLIGLATGASLACALASGQGLTSVLTVLAPALIGLSLAALVARLATLARNARLKPTSSLQSATGISHPKLRQISMGMTGGSFNTREFFHGMGAWGLRRMRWVVIASLFLIPLALQLAAHASGLGAAVWWLAVLIQWPGLLAERWLFFAQAQHPQNLYYQTVA